MAASESVNPADLLREQIEGASPDVLQAMIKTFAQALMSAEADAICGAGYGQRSDERVNSRNGYRAGSGTPAPGRSSWRSRSCARAPTSRTGC